MKYTRHSSAHASPGSLRTLRPSLDRRTSRSAGLTLLEVMVSILVLSVAVYILTSTVAASVTHSQTKAERNLAVEAAMNKIEQLRSYPQEDVFKALNSIPDDDPYGPATGPGPFFNVAGLNPQMTATGAPLPLGIIKLPESTGGTLVESSVLPAFGLPRDLNGDLVISTDDRADDYLVLPITIRIQWQGRTGPRSFELSTMLADMAKWQD